MYAKIEATQWGFGESAASMIEGCDLWLNHEPDCPMQEGLDTTCDCYVSRLRLIPTPVGESLPTPEPDPNTYIQFWHQEFLEENKRHRRTGWILIGICTYMLLDAALRFTGVWG